MRGLARRLVADAHTADDLAQQTWAAASQRPVEALSLRGWLTAVARRLASRHRRNERRRAERERAAARPDAVPSAAEIVAREAMRAEVVLGGLLLIGLWILPPRESGADPAAPSAPADATTLTAAAPASAAPAINGSIDTAPGAEREAVALPAAPTTGSLRVRVVFDEDQSAAAGVLLELHPGWGDSLFDSVRATTDALGTVSYANASPPAHNRWRCAPAASLPGRTPSRCCPAPTARSSSSCNSASRSRAPCATRQGHRSRAPTCELAATTTSVIRVGEATRPAPSVSWACCPAS